MTSGIYILTNKANGRRYIGYSVDIEARWEDNKNQLKRGGWKYRPLMNDDWQKHGENAFSWGILEVLDTKEPAEFNKRAKYWKDLIKPEYNQKIAGVPYA